MPLFIQRTQLSLIHIPLNLYSNFLHSILKLLLPLESGIENGAETNGNGTSGSTPWAYDHKFTNISVTPIECSIVCSKNVADKIFVPARNSLPKERQNEVSITAEDYVVIQVDGEGLEAGQRVLELTSPLAMAGIPIFFITTYFSDYILVPTKARLQVTAALSERGFDFQEDEGTHVTSPLNAHNRNRSSNSSLEMVAPSTPPPTSIAELQTRTFSLLKKRSIVPSVNPDIRLVQCAGNSMNTDSALHLGLVKCLTLTPQFLSLTLTDGEEPSLLLEQRLLRHFPADALLGATTDVMVPISLDLRDLPLESTGIVCGVAGRLVGVTSMSAPTNGNGSRNGTAAVEMSYLSTARAGNVMVAEDELDRAVEALRGAASGVLAPS
ncbi:MAG: hypothetical protein M1820_009274 [Bogoriella megaspora]|nr:MAG: hypothetical protein M1820_009274 [Bogoriella megaspora]